MKPELEIVIGTRRAITRRSWRTLWRSVDDWAYVYLTKEAHEGTFYDIRAQMRPWKNDLGVESLVIEQSS